MVLGLRANVGVVANNLDVAPDGRVGLGGETAEIFDITVLEDLNESGTWYSCQ